MAAQKPTDNPVAERNTRGQKAGQAITLALRARCAGFWIVSKDESRTEQDLIPAIAKAGYRPRIWDIANGAVDIDGSPSAAIPTTTPLKAPTKSSSSSRTAPRLASPTATATVTSGFSATWGRGSKESPVQ